MYSDAGGFEPPHGQRPPEAPRTARPPSCWNRRADTGFGRVCTRLTLAPAARPTLPRSRPVALTPAPRSRTAVALTETQSVKKAVGGTVTMIEPKFDRISFSSRKITEESFVT
jgi:hypothetical protein